MSNKIREFLSSLRNTTFFCKLFGDNSADLDNLETEEEEIEHEAEMNDEEYDPEKEGTGIKKIALWCTAGFGVILSIIILFPPSFLSFAPSKENKTERRESAKIPNFNENAISTLPKSYSEIPKKEEKPQEPVPPVQPDIVQITIPQPSAEEKEAEKQYNEVRNKILSSAIAFNIGNSTDNNANAASSSYSPVYKKPSDSYVTGFTLTAGAIIPATMLTGATSDVANADVVAQVRQDVYDSKTGKHLIIPQGAKIIGKSGSAGERGNKRLGIAFERIIFPDGSSITLPKQNAIDGPGMPGLKDKYTQHSSQLMRSAVLAAVFAAAAASTTKNTGGTNNYNRTAGEEALTGAVTSVLDTAQTIIQRDANLSPSIIIRPGLQFNVFINKDFTLKEYVKK